MTDNPNQQALHIVGGGLAGCEAAWQIVGRGLPVVLHEMRPLRTTAAHKTSALAELVCSNSFRSDDKEHNAVGLLHEEMRRLGSLILRAADTHQVPAGGALAVDRDGFSAAISNEIAAQPLIEVRREEVGGTLPADWTSVIIATGPLTSPALADTITQAGDFGVYASGVQLSAAQITIVNRAAPAKNIASVLATIRSIAAANI